MDNNLVKRLLEWCIRKPDSLFMEADRRRMRVLFEVALLELENKERELAVIRDARKADESLRYRLIADKEHAESELTKARKNFECEKSDHNLTGYRLSETWQYALNEALEDVARSVAKEFEETNGQTVANFILKQIAAPQEGQPLFQPERCSPTGGPAESATVVVPRDALPHTCAKDQYFDRSCKACVDDLDGGQA